MTERQTYKALKLIQKRTMNPNKYKRICENLVNSGLADLTTTGEKTTYELTIKGLVAIWDYENWRLIS